MNHDYTTLLFEKAKALQEKMIEYRRYLHANPEIGLSLPKTQAYVREQLEALGYQPSTCGESGLVALAGGKTPGKVFLLRADMDALPIREQTDVPFASTNEYMHGCGHDMHTAMLLGAATLLKEYEDDIQGTIKLMFQPGEEIMAGAKEMIVNGVLENPTVDAGLMIHVMAGTPIPVGTVIVAPSGVSAPACDNFKIEIQGKGGHASMPDQANDPILVGCQIHTALHTILSRELSMNDHAVLTVASFQAGNTGNVIPDTATLQGTLRTMDEEVRNYVKNRLATIVTSTATTFRCTANLTYTGSCPTLYNDKATGECIHNYLVDLLGASKTLSSSAISSGNTKTKTVGSEDFAYISQQIPSIMLALSAGSSMDGYSYSQHHPKVMFDEKALSYGAAVYAYSALRWLQEHKNT